MFKRHVRPFNVLTIYLSMFTLLIGRPASDRKIPFENKLHS